MSHQHSSTERQAPGWYSDPDDAGWELYWDGGAYTAGRPSDGSRRPAVVPVVDTPLRPAVEPPAPRRWRFGWVEWLVVIGAAVFAVSWLVVGRAPNGGPYSATITSFRATGSERVLVAMEVTNRGDEPGAWWCNVRGENESGVDIALRAVRSRGELDAGGSIDVEVTLSVSRGRAPLVVDVAATCLPR